MSKNEYNRRRRARQEQDAARDSAAIRHLTTTGGTCHGKAQCRNPGKAQARYATNQQFQDATWIRKASFR